MSQLTTRQALESIKNELSENIYNDLKDLNDEKLLKRLTLYIEIIPLAHEFFPKEKERLNEIKKKLDWCYSCSFQTTRNTTL